MPLFSHTHYWYEVGILKTLEALCTTEQDLATFGRNTLYINFLRYSNLPRINIVRGNDVETSLGMLTVIVIFLCFSLMADGPQRARLFCL